jgi:hypothetical protein
LYVAASTRAAVDVLAPLDFLEADLPATVAPLDFFMVRPWKRFDRLNAAGIKPTGLNNRKRERNPARSDSPDAQPKSDRPRHTFDRDGAAGWAG